MPDIENCLTVENDLGIQLTSIDFESGFAFVTFELFSEGHTMGDPIRAETRLTYSLPLNGQGKMNHDRIVGIVKKKLQADFARMAKSLEDQ